MSCFASEETQRRKAVDRRIAASIKRDKLNVEVKLLLLGAGECGKSTIVKQMKIIHGDGYSGAERAEFVPLIFQNILDSICCLIRAMNDLNIPYQNPHLREVGNELVRCSEEYETPPFAVIKFLWSDQGIQQAYVRRRQFQLLDSAKYYLDSLDRVSSSKFRPSDQDILRSRVPTTGILEYTFPLKRVTFRIVDVGGQRSQRRKWLHCFDDVTSLIFIVALSEYDQTLLESSTTNRMIESLTLYKHVTRERAFQSASVILFLNKMDLMIEKLPNSNVADYFPNYKGSPDDVEGVKKFFLDMFLRERDRVYPHFTTATDSANIKRVFDDVQDTILTNNLDEFHVQ